MALNFVKPDIIPKVLLGFLYKEENHITCKWQNRSIWQTNVSPKRDKQTERNFEKLLRWNVSETLWKYNPQARKSKTVFDFGLYAVDTGFFLSKFLIADSNC